MGVKMIFSYKTDGVKDYCQNSCIKLFVPSFIGLIIVLFSFYFSLYDYDSRLFVLLLTSLASLLSMSLAVFFTYNSWKKEYLSFNMNIEDEVITIKNRSSVRKIDINRIKNIYCDKNGNYYIKHSSFSKDMILKYIENKTELENILTNIKPIEQISNRSKIIHYIPSFFFIGIIIINNFDNVYLYMIFAFGIIISSIYSSVLLIIERDKKKRVIITSLLIYLFLIIFFTRMLFYVISYLRE
jgi:hypothetical protein